MKYIYYLFILFLVIFRRIIGIPMVFVAIPFRSYFRNVIYNYHLHNGIILKRLYERSPEKVEGGWILYNNNNHGSEDGFVKYRKVNKVKYYFALSFWLVLDDDSNEDTFDKGFNQTIINGERKSWLPQFIKDKLQEDNWEAEACSIKGNSFDLGDKRADCPLFGFWSVLFWTMRNTAYNYNYMYNQLTDESKAFQIVIFNRLFGWKEDGYLEINNKKIKTYSWEFGKKL